MYTWRSLKIIPQKQTDKELSLTEASLPEFETTREGVFVSKDVCIRAKSLNERLHFELKVENLSHEELMLLSVSLPSSNSQCVIIKPALLKGIKIAPGKSVMFEGLCTVKNMGRTRELVLFTFINFSIGRWITFSLESNSNGCYYEKATSADRGSIMLARTQFKNSRSELIRGQKPSVAPRFIAARLPEYPVPQKLLNIVTRHVCPRLQHQLLEELRLAKPCLDAHFTFNIYEDRFHTLLHLEELHEIMMMRSYAQDQACFVQNGEYMMLEIENLSEKRPSLMTGDRIIAKDPYKENAPELEGYIHKVGAKHVYIKFAQMFHDAYHGEDMSIMAVGARTTYRRMHQAIGLAIRNLGNSFLFPVKVPCKKPQSNFIYDEYSDSIHTTHTKIDNRDSECISKKQSSQFDKIISLCKRNLDSETNGNNEAVTKSNRNQEVLNKLPRFVSDDNSLDKIEVPLASQNGGNNNLECPQPILNKSESQEDEVRDSECISKKQSSQFDKIISLCKRNLDSETNGNNEAVTKRNRNKEVLNKLRHFVSDDNSLDKIEVPLASQNGGNNNLECPQPILNKSESQETEVRDSECISKKQSSQFDKIISLCKRNLDSETNGNNEAVTKSNRNQEVLNKLPRFVSDDNSLDKIEVPLASQNGGNNNLECPQPILNKSESQEDEVRDSECISKKQSSQFDKIISLCKRNLDSETNGNNEAVTKRNRNKEVLNKLRHFVSDDNSLDKIEVPLASQNGGNNNLECPQPILNKSESQETEVRDSECISKKQSSQFDKIISLCKRNLDSETNGNNEAVTKRNRNKEVLNKLRHFVSDDNSLDKIEVPLASQNGGNNNLECPQPILNKSESQEAEVQESNSNSHKSQLLLNAPHDSQKIKANKKRCLPSYNLIKPTGPLKLEWFNKSLNYYQKEAVRNILLGEARPLPYFIFGPPGTGKTVTLVETILQLLRLIPHSRLLVATPSNSAADLIATRLIDSGVLKPGDLIRLVAYHCVVEDKLPVKLIPYCATADIAREGTHGHVFNVTSKGLSLGCNSSVLGRHRVTVGTCSSLAVLFNMGFSKGHFTHVIVDEAGQATEPEVMIPLALLDVLSGQVILAGDPLQLGPVICSKAATVYGLEETYLDRMLNRFPYVRDPQGFPKTGGYDPRLITRLVYNYRSLPDVLVLSSNMFYNGQLIATISPDDSKEATLLDSIKDILPVRKAPTPPAVVFHGVIGENYQTADCPSWFNPNEASQIFYYVNELYRLGLKSTDIGIISPYIKQVKQIRALLNEAEFDVPKVGTVEEFQGQEFNVILLTTVRSSENMVEHDLKHKIGFLANPRRVNVAISRAQALMIIVGNPHLLCNDSHWRHVIRHCVETGAYCGCDLPSYD